MSIPTIVSPLDEKIDWQIELSSLAELLQTDWPEANVWFEPSQAGWGKLEWFMYDGEQSYQYGCSVEDDHKTISFDCANWTAIAPMVVWYRNNIVPASIRLYMVLPDITSLEIPYGVSVNELLELDKNGPQFQTPPRLLQMTDKQITELIEEFKNSRGGTREAIEYSLSCLGNRIIPFVWEALTSTVDGELDYGLLGLLSNLGEAALPLLEQVLANGTTQMRDAVVYAFWGNPQPVAVHLLAKALADSDTVVRRDAAIALADLRKDALPAVDALLESLTRQDEDEDTRMEIIGALGYTRTPQAFEPLLGVFTSPSESKYVRINAALALAQTGGRKAIKPLFSALDTDDKELANNIWGAIEVVYDEREVEQLSTLLQKGKFNAQCIRLLGQLGEIAIEPLLTTFITQPDERYSVVEALGRIGKPAIKVLLELVEPHQDAHTRLRAMYGLTDIHETVLIPSLVLLAKDSDANIRRYAVNALGKYHQPRLNEVLLEALSDPSEEVQIWGLCALEENGFENIFELALQHVEDENAKVRVAAYRILGRSGRSEALAILERAKKTDEGLDEYNRKACYAAADAWRQLYAKLRADAKADQM